MDSEWSVDTLDGTGVALVTVELRNPSPVPRRVRVANRLDGPVLPPRRAGVPEDGWHDDGFDGVVPAEGRRVLGYACPAATSTPPVTVADDGRATADGQTRTAAARDLGDPRPPADAIPVEHTAGPGYVGDDGDVGDVGDDRDDRDDEEDRGDGDDGDDAVPSGEKARIDRHEAVADDSVDTTDGLPTPVESWLATVERRIERGERLTDASVETTVDVLEACESVEALSECVAADADALQRLAIRASALAARADDVDVPVDDLRRFA